MCNAGGGPCPDASAEHGLEPMARILIVDADRTARLALEGALRRAGGEVETAAVADEALDAARERPFDLVAIDARIDDGGVGLLRRLRSLSPAPDVVMMAEAGSIEGAVEAMRLGARSYVQKPAEAAALLALCRADALAGPPSGEDAALVDGIVGSARPMQDLLDLVRKVAATDSTVLITGETGTGKELVGRALHRASRRHGRSFCALNSAAFPETLLESELFGHRRGAFTGAAQSKRGLLESAHTGTVFLDEVAEMPLSMQAKLLRFLQTGEIRPVGADATRVVDVRLVTATNKDLENEVRAGRFREDLYYRLAVIPVHVPALRERREDVPALALHFLRRFVTKIGKAVDGIDADAMDLLTAYAWPGNVRELENTIERGVALCRGPRLGADDLPDRLRAGTREAPDPDRPESLEHLEKRHILSTLESVGWSRKRAAEILQISTTTLWRRLKVFGVESQAPAAGAWVRSDAGPGGP